MQHLQWFFPQGLPDGSQEFLRSMLGVSQPAWLVFLAVAVTLLIGLSNPGGVFPMGVWCFTGFASLFPVVFAAIYWKRANKWGAMASVVTVAALWLWFLDDALTGEFLIADMMPVTFLLAASSVAMVAGSLLTPAPPPDLQEKFFPSKKA